MNLPFADFAPEVLLLMKRLLLSLTMLMLAGSALAQRLPDTVVPSHYVLQFAPSFVTDDFTGKETIRIEVRQPLSAITLNALDLELERITVTAGGATQTATATFDPMKQQATLALPHEIPAGPATIEVEFKGKLNDKLRGFYLSKSATRKYAVTQFESTDARRAFPSFDEPAMKATFDITLVVDKGDTAISNGRIVSDKPGPGETKHTVKFATTPKMSTYLVAMLVGDFRWVAGEAEGVPIRIIATPGKEHLGIYALEAAKQILTFYNRYYGIKYPFGKLDVIAVPDFEAGAMENTAAIVYRETALLIDEKTASLASRRSVADILAHEMGHMWFGDLVTMQWWDDIWLNEGFATWITAKPVAAWKPEWHVDVIEAGETQRSLAADSLRATRAIRSRASTPAEIDQLFDGIAYGKTAAVLRMIEMYVGEEPFRKGINTYLQRHAYGNATGEDFWNTLTEVTGKPVDRIMKSFVEQAGAPLVTVKSECADGKTRLTLSQQRFYGDGAKDGEQLWTIPVCFNTSAGRRCELLTQREQTFTVDNSCDQDVFVDAGGDGFYRFAYEPAALRRIAATALTKLSAPERAALAGNSWALVRAGRLPVADFLAMEPWFRGERERAVASGIYEDLQTIGETLTTPGNDARYRQWVRGVMAPVVAELGWAPVAGESEDRRSLRGLALGAAGTTGLDRQVMSDARDLLRGAMKGTKQPDPFLMPTLVELAAFGGDAALYDEMLAKSKASRGNPTEYYRFFNGLTDFRDPALVRRTLALSISPDMRSQDASSFLGMLLGNPAARRDTWEFMKANWPEVEKKLTIASGARLVRASGNFCDAASRDDVVTFFKEHPVQASDRSLRQAVERINSCIAFREGQGGSLEGFLKK
jgi:aminopeptidase N